MLAILQISQAQEESGKLCPLPLIHVYINVCV